jgi:hypothetical protein
MHVMFTKQDDWRAFSAELDAQNIVRGQVEYGNAFWWKGPDWRGDLTFVDAGDAEDAIHALAIKHGADVDEGEEVEDD